MGDYGGWNKYVGDCGSPTYTELITYIGRRTNHESLAELRKDLLDSWVVNEKARINSNIRARNAKRHARLSERTLKERNDRIRCDILSEAMKSGGPDIDLFGDVDLPCCGHDDPDDCNEECERSITRSDNYGIPFIDKSSTYPQRLAGIEVEYNNRVDMSSWVKTWHGHIHSDGSCGWEAVTTPVSGSYIDSCLKSLSSSFRQKGVRSDDRCGVHVHVDAHDVDWESMRMLVRIYQVIEPVLYAIAGQSRVHNSYARPIGARVDTESPRLFKRSLIDAYGIELFNRPEKKANGRYKGLNAIPWLVGRRVGALDSTIEFRMHRNTLNHKRIAAWVHLLVDLVEWAKNASDSDYRNLPKSPARMLAAVSPRSKVWITKCLLEWRRSTSTAEEPDDMNKTKRAIAVKNGVWSCVV